MSKKKPPAVKIQKLESFLGVLQIKLDPSKVDRTLDAVTVLLDAMTVDLDPPAWDSSDSMDVRDAYELIGRLQIDQQVAFLRHCALKIRSSIIEREIENEIGGKDRDSLALG